MPKTTAQIIESHSYTEEGYFRPSDLMLAGYGGTQISSSNWDPDGAPVSSGWSFSPTDRWHFEDGSVLEVTYSGCYAS
jgi:hypothetical protein